MILDLGELTEGNATFKAIPMFSTQAYYTAAQIPPNFAPSKARRGMLMHPQGTERQASFISDLHFSTAFLL